MSLHTKKQEFQDAIRTIEELEEMGLAQYVETISPTLFTSGTTIYMQNALENASDIRHKMRVKWGKYQIKYYSLYGKDLLAVKYIFENNYIVIFYEPNPKETLEKLSKGKCKIKTVTHPASEEYTTEKVICEV